MSTVSVHRMLQNPQPLKRHIVHVLHEGSREAPFFPRGISASDATSAVLFLLAPRCPRDPSRSIPCVVLNRRSRKVRQPGDLCFPGGSVASRFDPYFARLLRFPLLPLGRWPHWREWREARYSEARRLGLLFAASLRESFEEMRLNPLGVTFLGPLPSQSLVMFQRTIYPMVGWIGRQRRFAPNWEVDRIVHIPLANLLDQSRYGCYRIDFRMGNEEAGGGSTQDFLCFIHGARGESEVLWGATLRIVLVFLEMAFGFCAPDPRGLPLVRGSLDDTYLSGEWRQEVTGRR